MHSLKNHAHITSGEEFNEHALQVFENFLEEITDDRRYVIPINKGGELMFNDELNWGYLYTAAGVKIIEDMLRRISKLATSLYPDYDFDFTTHLYQEQ